MITCEVVKSKGIKEIKISGHSNYANSGNDIVCAGVSTLVFAIANKILTIESDFDLTINENEFIFINNKQNDKINLLLETLIEGIELVIVEYSENIEIKEVVL